MDYRVLLFYKYINFPEPQKFQQDHLRFCEKNDIMGRVWISTEGINATVSGKINNIKKYKLEIKSIPGLRTFGSKKINIMNMHSRKFM